MNQKGFANMVIVGILIILAGAVVNFTLVRKSTPVTQQTPTSIPTQTQTSTANKPSPTNGSPQLFIYAQGDIKAKVSGLDIKEIKVPSGAVKVYDAKTGKMIPVSPSVMYEVDIKLDVLSVNGINPEYLKVGSDISMHYGWEATKPKFLKDDTIKTGIELVGTSPQYNPSNGYWRLKDDKNLWVR